MANDRTHNAAPASLKKVAVWDMPLRIFHWTLALAVLGLIVTGTQGGELLLRHAQFGYLVLGLLAFRVIWGLGGPRHARFSQFVRGPRALFGYLRLQREEKLRWIGHSPPGGYAILAMLLLLLAQAGTGLIADDEIAFSGPLAAAVPASWSATATWYHKTIGKPAILGMIGLHLSAVFYYVIVLRIPLISAMLTGEREIRG